MKLKTKLIASIMSICLVCAVFAIGVFALKTANLKIGGDVSFTATGVEAHIKNAKIEGAVTPTELDASDEEGKYINTSMTQTDIDNEFDSWQNLSLDFDENATDIVFSFDIANTASNVDNYIEIDYDYELNVENPNVVVSPLIKNANGDWENNNYILTPKGTGSVTYTSFKLAFRVMDKELNVSNGTSVTLSIELKHTTPLHGTLNNTILTGIDGIMYTLNSTNYTASVDGGNVDYSGDPNLKIASVVTDGTNNYIVTSVGWYAFNSGDESNQVIRNVIIPNSITIMGGEGMFQGTSLTSIKIGKGVMAIGIGDFSDCSNLTSITIPASVTSIAWGAFGNNTNLTSVKFEDPVGWGGNVMGDLGFYVMMTDIDFYDPAQNARFLTTIEYEDLSKN